MQEESASEAEEKRQEQLELARKNAKAFEKGGEDALQVVLVNRARGVLEIRLD